MDFGRECGGGGVLKAKTKSNEYCTADAERSFSPRESIYGELTLHKALATSTKVKAIIS